jgi:outer membrane receptor protein involved in Fe transport
MIFNIAPEDGRIQARGALTWNQGPWNAAGFVNFSGPKSIASTDVGIYHANSFTSVDVLLGYTIKDAGLLSNTVITVQVNNVFDRAPPLSSWPAAMSPLVETRAQAATVPRRFFEW